MDKKLQKIYKDRRNKFIKGLPNNSIVIVPNKSPAIRSHDVEYLFKPDPDFFYLTGFDEPHSVCILKKHTQNKHSFILFVEEKVKEKEIWVGKITGIPSAKSKYKADESYSIKDFRQNLKSHLLGFENVYFPVGKDKDLTNLISNIVNELRNSNRAGKKAPKTIIDSREMIHNCRLIKDSYEIECLKKACEITKDAHMLAMTCARPGMYEYELEALIEYKFKSSGSSGPAYPSIVGSGNNATTLHYIKNNKKIQKNDLVLIDAGCEFNNYAADLTRTYPVTKKFTSEQKDIYEIVLEAQLKTIAQVKKGKTFKNAFDKSVSVIVDGLKELKLLKGSKEEIIKKKKYKKFYMHNIGHWLGLDVHDAGPYLDIKNSSIKLAPGMVMTVEPGIYISNEEKDVPKGFRGIGIRIEDDVLITKSGNKVLTEGIPKTVDEIEALSF